MVKALIIVDIQNDFMPGGALEVAGGDEIIPLINQLSSCFSLVVASKDWHPPDHYSFASTHPDKKAGEMIDNWGISQVLWPVHCVYETWGAEFPSTLDVSKVTRVFHKGTDRRIDSYSSFFDNAHQRSTRLADFLFSKDVDEVYFVGVATDYCVLYSALDAIELGFVCFVILDACRAINLQENDEKEAIEKMRACGVKIIYADQILDKRSSIDTLFGLQN